MRYINKGRSHKSHIPADIVAQTQARMVAHKQEPPGRHQHKYGMHRHISTPAHTHTHTHMHTEVGQGREVTAAQGQTACHGAHTHKPWQVR